MSPPEACRGWKSQGISTSNPDICDVLKLTQIYDIVVPSEDVKYVVRVPSPDFPVDKLESEVRSLTILSLILTSREVATLQYIDANTSVPVPKVIAWSSDPSNSAGTEYMILEKVMVMFLANDPSLFLSASGSLRG